MKKIKNLFSSLVIVMLLAVSGCMQVSEKNAQYGSKDIQVETNRENETITIDTIPEYSDSPYVEINGNIPDFTEADVTLDAFEEYSELDSLGRCGTAYANICKELMPTEERGAIGHVKPSGWHTVKYNGLVDGNYLYNRCHLIGYQLAGENANEKNLITGTRYMNVEGMLPFEDQVADFVKATGYHVLYRVTPIFEGDNLVADGVEREAYSVEDEGRGVSFHVFVYNCPPGITIDYKTGESALDQNTKKENVGTAGANAKPEDNDKSVGNSQIETYVLNSNTKKFHKPDCSSVEDMEEQNKVVYKGTKEEIEAMGYEACKRCKP